MSQRIHNSQTPIAAACKTLWLPRFLANAVSVERLNLFNKKHIVPLISVAYSHQMLGYEPQGSFFFDLKGRKPHRSH